MSWDGVDRRAPAPPPLACVGDHGCRLPAKRRKYRNLPWICDCGQGWRIVWHWTWAGDWDEWVKWPEVAE